MDLQTASFLKPSPLRRALVSVSDKTGLKELAGFLQAKGCALVATSSTARELQSMGFAVSPIDDITRFPEILGGRVKTLHPAVFGAILSRPDTPEDEAELATHGIAPFDLVVCNLYPFQNVIAKTDSSLKDLVENIDIGGVTLLRAAAKNFARVGILCDPADYLAFMQAVENSGTGQLPGDLRLELGIKALSETAAYDEVISSTLKQACTPVRPRQHLSDGPVRARAIHAKTSPVATGEVQTQILPKAMILNAHKIQDLRYGENPHQKAAFYAFNTPFAGEGDSVAMNTPHGNSQGTLQGVSQGKLCSLAGMTCFHGKELSYNNVLDIEHGVRLVNEFARQGAGDVLPQLFAQSPAAAVIIKHNMPCGVGLSHSSLAESYTRAFESDPVSPFGGIVCLNAMVDRDLAEKLYETFLEVIVAPDYAPEALELLQRKKNLRLVRLDTNAPLANNFQVTHVQGGLLLQQADRSLFDAAAVTVPTEARIDETTSQALTFAYKVAKHVRSNAIVLANSFANDLGNNLGKSFQTLSIAGGFTNRVDAVEHCLRKSRLPLAGAVLASDAFFPFPDSIELLKGTGVRAIIQPGGSVQDAEVIKACNRLGIALMMTGQRHFKH